MGLPEGTLGILLLRNQIYFAFKYSASSNISAACRN